MKNVGLQLYRKIIGVFPQVASLPAEEGNRVKFDKDREVHLNIVNQANESSIILLNFYNCANEQGCYEIHLDHLKKVATSEMIRAETEQSLYTQIVQIERAPIKIRSILTRTGYADTNQMLFSRLQSLIPNLETAGTGKTDFNRGKTKSSRSIQEIYILQNDLTEAMLEISPINIDGISKMTIALDKKKRTAGVVEISGIFGRYPSYLPYPDGKEMMPQEREKYSQILLNYFDNANGKLRSAIHRI